MAQAIYSSVLRDINTVEQYRNIMSGRTLPSHKAVFTRTAIEVCIGALIARRLWKLYESRERRNGRRTSLLTRSEAPEWAQQAFPADITDGFRRECALPGCICTCGGIHNETFNIWSHGITAVWFTNLIRLSKNTLTKAIACGAAICMSTSATAHLLGGMNSTVNNIIFRFDRAGIAFDFWIRSIVIAIMHFGGRKEFKILRYYRVAISILGIGAMGVLFAGSALSARSKFMILLMQMAVGSFPVLRDLYTSRSKPIMKIILKYLPLASIPAILGGLAFSNNFPEKYIADRKNKDFLSYIGNSHNIMHILVAISLLMSHRGICLYVNEKKKSIK